MRLFLKAQNTIDTYKCFLQTSSKDIAPNGGAMNTLDTTLKPMVFKYSQLKYAFENAFLLGYKIKFKYTILVSQKYLCAIHGCLFKHIPLTPQSGFY